MYLIQLLLYAVLYETRLESAHVFKTEKYMDLADKLKMSGFQTKVLAVEVGARGFVGASAYSLMKQLPISGRERDRALKALAEAAEKGSSWIWARRNKNELHKA